MLSVSHKNGTAEFAVMHLEFADGEGESSPCCSLLGETSTLVGGTARFLLVLPGMSDDAEAACMWAWAPVPHDAVAKKRVPWSKYLRKNPYN
jgi:hypothetical protein